MWWYMYAVANQPAVKFFLHILKAKYDQTYCFWLKYIAKAWFGLVENNTLPC